MFSYIRIHLKIIYIYTGKEFSRGLRGRESWSDYLRHTKKREKERERERERNVSTASVVTRQGDKTKPTWRMKNYVAPFVLSFFSLWVGALSSLYLLLQILRGLIAGAALLSSSPSGI